MCLAEAKLAARDVLGAAPECLIIEACITGRPVQVSPGQDLPPVLAVVGHPRHALKVPGLPNDGSLVGPELCCLVKVPFGGDCCQPTEAFQPQHCICHGWTVGSTA